MSRDITKWSWGESNPRPPRGHRPRYDHSRVLGSRLPICRVSCPEGRPPGLSQESGVFPSGQRSLPPSTTASVAGLQWSGPAWPVGSQLRSHHLRSGGESEFTSVMLGVCVGAPFFESEQLGPQVRLPLPTSKPHQPRRGRPSFRPPERTVCIDVSVSSNSPPLWWGYPRVAARCDGPTGQKPK
jgi:hypothetical protein